jgi:hypothetical protein
LSHNFLKVHSEFGSHRLTMTDKPSEIHDENSDKEEGKRKKHDGQLLEEDDQGVKVAKLTTDHLEANSGYDTDTEDILIQLTKLKNILTYQKERINNLRLENEELKSENADLRSQLNQAETGNGSNDSSYDIEDSEEVEKDQIQDNKESSEM